MVAKAADGTTPASMRASTAAISSCSQRSNLASSLQIAEMSFGE
jgi:hypothetical protein